MLPDTCSATEHGTIGARAVGMVLATLPTRLPVLLDRSPERVADDRWSSERRRPMP